MLTFHDRLGSYIFFGEVKLSNLDAKTIRAKEAVVTPASRDKSFKLTKKLRDMRAWRNNLECHVHDIKLIHQVMMQFLPSIRLVQENDKSQLTKINSTLNNTVPSWENHLAQAVTFQRSAEASMAVRIANDMTDELLISNAANLRFANKITRTEKEHGVFDIKAIKKANADLIGTIEESLQIADEGKHKRAEAEKNLKTWKLN